MIKVILFWSFSLVFFVLGAIRFFQGLFLLGTLLIQPEFNLGDLLWVFSVYILFGLVELAVAYILYAFGRDAFSLVNENPYNNSGMSYKDIVNF